MSLPGDCHASHASLLTNRLSQAAVGCLMLAYSFSSRAHSIPWGPRFSARNDKKCVARNNARVCKQPPNANLWLGSCPLERTRLIAERASSLAKWSVYAQQPRFRANALHLTRRVRLLAMSAAFDFRKCKRLLLSSLAVSVNLFAQRTLTDKM